MNELPITKKRGPKPSGIEKVVYYRRVKPELIPALDYIVKDKVPRLEMARSDPKPEFVHVGADEMLTKYKNDNRAMLDTIGVMEERILSLQADVIHFQEMDLDEKGKLGWRKYYEIKNKGAGEGVQSDPS